MLKYIAKRYKWKYGIKYATYCFFYLNMAVNTKVTPR